MYYRKEASNTGGLLLMQFHVYISLWSILHHANMYLGYVQFFWPIILTFEVLGDLDAFVQGVQHYCFHWCDLESLGLILCSIVEIPVYLLSCDL